MAMVYVILLLFLLVSMILIDRLLGRSYLSNLAIRIRDFFKPPQASTGITVIDQTGAEISVLARNPHAKRNRRQRLQAQMRYGRDQLRAAWKRQEWGKIIAENKRLLSVLVVMLIGLFALTWVPTLRPNRLDQFIVLVAPFNDPDGTVSRTGQSVADQLTATLASDGRVRAQRMPRPPDDLNAALAMMNREGADALIWGTVTPGGMLDQPSLTPLLAYRPVGGFAPLGWEGYSERFAMPTFYTLADAPIEGRVVLPDLLAALADYGAGRVDSSFTTLGALTANTPALMPALPYALRGNILWARGDYDQAAGEYRRALGQPDRREREPLPDPRPLLINNLGAIQEDAGDPRADETFAQADTLLEGAGLGSLRYNQGIGYLHAGKFDDAVRSLESARGLLPPTPPFLLVLSEAYRMDGRFQQAREALNAALQQVTTETLATTSDLRDLTDNRLRAAAAEQSGLLGLAEFLQARGPLRWELQISDQLSPQALSGVRDDLAEAVQKTDALVQGWSRRSATEDASDHPIGGRLAINQFRRAQLQLADRRLWQDAVNIETARAQGVERPSGFAAFWNRLVGDRSALGKSREDLKQLLTAPPNDVDETILYGETLLLTDGPVAAADWFDKATAADPKRPEWLYSQALVAIANDDHLRARDLLAKAIQLDERYFPARQKLAEIAQADAESAEANAEAGADAQASKDWAVAAEQRRWLAQHRPSFANTLKLASTLRRWGVPGYAEAERALLSLVNDDTHQDVDKVLPLVELGRLYYDNQDFDGARAVLERAQRAAPRDPDAAYELGRVYAAQGDPISAKAQFQTAIANDPHPFLAHIALAKLYANNPDMPELFAEEGDEAIANHYRAALDAGANDPVSLRLIGKKLLDEGEFEPAASAYTRLVALTPKDPAAYHGLAQANLQIDRLDAAQAAEQKAIELKGGPYPEALVGLGDIALRRDKPDEAVDDYNAALQQNPNLAAAYIGLGRVSAKAGNWAVAAAHFRRAISHDSSSAEAHFWLGEALRQQGDANAAIAEYNQAVALKQNYAEAYYGLARAHADANRPREAEAILPTALSIRPKYAEAWLEQGKLHEQRGDDPGAINAYNRAIDANGKLAEARYRRGLLLIRQERMSEAENDLAAATGAQPNFPEAHYWLGRVYLAQNRALAARDEFKTAVTQRGGNYPDALFYQGIAEEQLGQRTEAISSFKTALDQGGDSVWAGDARTELMKLGNP
jgi:tetratricopeptide (TPR) repeat protein